MLVADALFCHKCGRPVRELMAEPEPPTLSEAALSEATAEAEKLRAAAAYLAPPIGFQNSNAVRIAATIGALGALLGFLPVPALFSGLWMLVTLLSAGFVAVYLYQRRTGELPSVRGGARLGWMSGMFTFVVMLVKFVIELAYLSSQGGLGEQIRKQLVAANDGSPQLDELVRALESPTGLAMFFTTLILLLFLLLTALPMIGGALGAKVLEKE